VLLIRRLFTGRSGAKLGLSRHATDNARGPVNIHKNARLTPVTRLEVVRRARRRSTNQSALARAYHISRQTLRKWVRRFDADGVAGLEDRSSRPHRCPHRLKRTARRQIARRRAQRWSSCRTASDLHLPIAAVVREHRRLGLATLPRLEPPRPVIRYEWPRAGDLLHLDVKKLARIRRVGHRIHGDRSRRAYGAGWEYVHVAIDDCTRVPYAETLADETGATTVGFLQRALAFYRARGIQVRRLLTDNGTNYRSKLMRAEVARRRLMHRFTRPYTPRTNGKAERFIRTLVHEWAYAQAYRTSADRSRALSRFLYYFTTQRRHYGLHGNTPAERLAQVL
jgi:transposase-like protein